MKYIIFCLPLLLASNLPPQRKLATSGEKRINWMTWAEAMEANDRSAKKILVDVFTDWCSWCKVMDRETFSDSLIIDYIDEHFYAVKLNAEQRETINWNGQEFNWAPKGRNGVHELAQALCDGQMSFPTLVFLTEKHERIRISKGFKDALAFYPELVYVAEEHYLKNAD